MWFTKAISYARSAIRPGKVGHFMRTNLLLILFLCAVFALTVNQLGEYDAWFHLKTGEYIVENLTVPTQDIFSYTAPGAEWVTHSWLPEVIFYLVYKAVGLWGLIFFCALALTFSYYLMVRIARRWGGNDLILFLFVSTITFLKIPTLSVPRPHLFSFMLLLGEILLLEHYLATKSRKYLFLLPVLFFVWANMHASIVLGFAILGFYMLFARELIPYFVASLAIAFVNPNTYKIFTYQFAVEEVTKALRVVEWFSVWAYRYYPGTQIFLAGLFMANAWCVASALAKRTARNLRFAGLMLGFSGMLFLSIRHIGYFPLIAFPILSVKLGEAKTVRSILSKISTDSMKFVVVLFMMLFMIAGYLHWPKKAVSETALPVKAVDFVLAEGIHGPVFNMYNEGGYLIWRLWPAEKVFIDGRSEIYKGQPLKDYQTIIGFGKGWQDLVNGKYGINYVIFPTTPSSIERFVRIATIQFLDNGFKLVYKDDSYIVLLRDAKENAEIIRKFEIDPKEFLGEKKR